MQPNTSVEVDSPRNTRCEYFIGTTMEWQANHFDKLEGAWESEVPTVEHLVNEMLDVFDRTITVEQATRLMRARKQSYRTCTELYQYLVTVASSALLRSIVFQHICDGTTRHANTD